MGNIIKLKRFKNKMTQEELSIGICTPSYLSRIENNQVVAGEDVYHLLFKKLGIQYENNESPATEIDIEIEEWYLTMLKRKRAITNMNELKQSAKSSGNGVSIKFDIVYCRYLLMNGDFDQAGEALLYLGKIIQNKRSRSFFIYTNILMVYYHLKEEYAKALRLGLDLIEIDSYRSLAKDNYEIAMFYYNIALNYSRIRQFRKCIHFSEKSLNIFNNNYDFDRALDCQLLLGIAHNNLNNWEQSIHAYHLAKKILKLFPIETKENYYGKIYNNLGYCYERQNEFTKSINYYEKGLEYKKDTNDRLQTVINLVRCNHVHGNKEQARDWLQLGLDFKNKNAQQKYILQLDIYALLLQDTNIAIEDLVKLQTTSIKFFSENYMRSLVSEYANLFASLYERYSHYKKANDMYKLSLTTMKEIETSRL